MDQIVGIFKLLKWKTKIQNLSQGASFEYRKVHTRKTYK